MKKLCERLGKEILFFDGGSGTLLQSRGLPAGTPPEKWNVDNPEEIIRLHSEYIEAGADIIKTNTFGVNPLRYPEGGEYTVGKLVSAAMDCAEAAKKKCGSDTYIALDIGPCGKLVGADIGFEEAVKCFSGTVIAGRERADLVLLETFGSLAETRAALLAVKENCDLPVIVTNVYEKNGRTFTGSGADVCAAVLSGMKADAVGMNCSLGPDEMLKVLPEFIAHTDLPVCVNPNAGLPKTDASGRVYYDVSPEHFAACGVKMAKMGVSILGGCCGTTPEYIKKLRKAVSGIEPKQRPGVNKCAAASVSELVEIGKSGICVIGERINPTGKPKFREALRTGDYDYCVNEAHTQTLSGASVLDVNVGIPDIDEKKVLPEIIDRVQQVTPLPLQPDTSSPEAMEAALRVYNGRALINSVNGSEKSMSSLLPLAAKYGGVVIGLTLDESGIPETPEGRLAIAERIVSRAAEYGISKDEIIIDPLTLTLGADPLAAEKTLSTVRMIKEKLGVRCSLGISNISFGLPDREKINAGFLAAAMNAGLDAAIINPNSEVMMNVARGKEAGDSSSLKISQTPAAAKDDGTLCGCIYGGMKDRAAAIASALCDEKDPKKVISEDVIPALDRAGKEFGEGVIFLPGLLACANAAISALGVISERIGISGESAGSRGRVVLATVEGDVHDIGKNIVGVMLRSYGFEVIDLGKNVPADNVVKAVKDSGALVCGLSALMTTTVPSMERTIALLGRECPGVKTVVGGAVLTEDYANKIGADCFAEDASATVRFAQEIYGK